MGKRHIGFDIWWPEQLASRGILRRYLIPHPGTLIMTLLVVSGLLWAGSVGAIPLRAPTMAGTSTGTIAYQGRLADSAGTPITATVNMEFRLYDVPTGGAPLWNELWTGANAVRVSDGLFNVMLGSLNPIGQDVIAGHDQLYLGITVGTDDEMTPRVQLGSVPFAVQALTVPDGSVTPEKLDRSYVTTAGKKVTDSYTIGDASSPLYQMVGVGNIPQPSGTSTNGSGLGFVWGANQVSPVIWMYGNPNRNEFRVLRRSWNTDIENNQVLFSVDTSGNGVFAGSVTQGAVIERNLLAADELEAERIDRFSEGDVLCWAGKQLEKCDQANDRRVVAVADENGKPIVIGAELIKVLGPAQVGDLLVASGVAGYAMVNNKPAPGTVIAKVLEAFGGEKALVKATIRTP